MDSNVVIWFVLWIASFLAVVSIYRSGMKRGGRSGGSAKKPVSVTGEGVESRLNRILPLLSEEGKEAFSDIASEAADTVVRKNSDYGDAWQVHGVVGVLVRISDKSLRLKSLKGKSALVVEESIRDTLMDIMCYAALGLMYIEKGKED